MKSLAKDKLIRPGILLGILFGILVLSLGLLYWGPRYLLFLLALVLFLASLVNEGVLLFFIGLALVAGQLYRLDLGFVSLALVDLAMVAAVLFYLRFFLSKLEWQKRLRREILFVPVLALAIWFFLSWLFSLRLFSLNEIWPGLLYLVRLVGFLVLLLLLPLRSQDQGAPRFGRWVRGVLGVVVLVGFGQWFFFPDLRLLERWGWDPHLFRLTGSFLDPNLLAGFLILGIAAVWRYARSFFLVLLSLVALLATLSRSGWLALGGFLAGMLIWLRRWQIGLLEVLLLAAILLTPTARTRLVDLVRWGPTVQARLENFQEGLALVRAHPLSGIGFNNLPLVRAQAGNKLATEKSKASLDNSFLFIAATSGLVGLAFYLWFLLALLKKIFYQLRHPFLGLGILALILQSLFVNSLFYSPVLFLLALALASQDEPSG